MVGAQVRVEVEAEVEPKSWNASRRVAINKTPPKKKDVPESESESPTH